MPYAQEAFGTLGETVVLPERSITAADVKDADILAIRSTTKVDRALLEGSRVKFVGTATIGTDHMDLNYLDEAKIEWCHSPGCNANSVSEYVMAGLLCLATRHNFRLESKTMGVVGVGNVGSLVVQKARLLGMRVLMNDPPRRRATEAQARTHEFVELPHLLKEAEILTFHVPLTRIGTDITYQMANQKLFSKLPPGCILINSARGGVVKTADLLAAVEQGIIAHTIIDTWEGEPACRADLLKRADIGTPHVAGYSFEGKVMGTLMVYREACRVFGRTPTWTPDGLLPPPLVPEIQADALGRREEVVLWEIVRQLYDIEADDRRFREPESAPAEPAKHFDHLRQNYPIRREFPFTKVTAASASPKLRKKIAGLGFQLAE
jgi:erythronate-4-phosphate dehydrogenase